MTPDGRNVILIVDTTWKVTNEIKWGTVENGHPPTENPLDSLSVSQDHLKVQGVVSSLWIHRTVRFTTYTSHKETTRESRDGRES